MSDHLAANRAHWTANNARYTDRRARQSWSEQPITWGAWSRPEADIGALPDVRGKAVIELGCGTGYFGAWLKRRGAGKVVGVDLTPAQLATAQRINSETGLGLTFVEANAEFLPVADGSFDLAVSEYGASIWCDPYKWIPEAARVLRPGGELVFLATAVLVTLCSPEDGPSVLESLQRPQRGMHRLDWADDGDGAGPCVEFAIGHGEMFRLLKANGLAPTDLIEVYAAEDAADHEFYSFVPAGWASRWPAEEIWRAQKQVGKSASGDDGAEPRGMHGDALCGDAPVAVAEDESP